MCLVYICGASACQNLDGLVAVYFCNIACPSEKAEGYLGGRGEGALQVAEHRLRAKEAIAAAANRKKLKGRRTQLRPVRATKAEGPLIT